MKYNVHTIIIHPYITICANTKAQFFFTDEGLSHTSMVLYDF